MSEEKRIAWFANNREDSLSCYTSVQLIPLLENEFEIDWVFENRKVDDADLYFYQIENIHENEFIREHALENPGVILYHHLFDPCKDPYFDAELAKAARQALFTQERNAEEFKRISELNTKTSYLPYPVSFKENKKSASSQIKKICFCGGPEHEWRAEKVLQALKELEDKFVFYWLVGKSQKKAAEKIIENFKSLDLRLLSNKSPKTWKNLLTDADLAIHTLYSAFHDHGAYLPISFSEAVPCIVSNFGAAEYLPDQVCYKVSAGVDEIKEIKSAIDQCLSKQDNSKAAITYQHAMDIHDAKNVASELSCAFQAASTDEEFQSVLKSLKR